MVAVMIFKYLAVLLAMVMVVVAQDYTSPIASSYIPTSEASSSAAASSSIDKVSSISTDNQAASASTSSSSSSTFTSIASRITDTLYSCQPTTSSAFGNFVTIFNTFYIDVCPTGTTSINYIITDTCGCQHSTDYTRPTGCPSGFTVTEKTCTACPGQPVITVTTPIAGPGSTAPYNPHGNTTLNPPNRPPSNPTSNPHSNSSPISSPNSRPSYVSTSGAMQAVGHSMLALFMVMTVALVAGLMCIL